MKRILWVSILVIGIVVNALAADVPMKFAWDPDVAGETVVPWQAVEIYSRVDGAYDFNSPIVVVPQSYVDGKSSPSITEEILLTFPDGVKTTMKFVARSKASVGGESLFSAESDEITYTADVTPLETFVLEGAYNEVSKTIDLAWPSTDSRIESWKVWASANGNEPFTEIAAIDRVNGVNPSVSLPENTLFPEGKLTKQYFFVTAYGMYGLETARGEAVIITRDRRTNVPGVVNFTIILE